MFMCFFFPWNCRTALARLFMGAWNVSKNSQKNQCVFKSQRLRELQIRPSSHLPARDAPKDQKQTCTNSRTHALVFQLRTSGGRKTGFFCKRGFLPLPRTGGFDENGENDECTFCPQKTRGFAPQALENDENDPKWRDMQGSLFAEKPCVRSPENRNKTCTNLHPVVEDSPAKELPAVGSANSGRFWTLQKGEWRVVGVPQKGHRQKEFDQFSSFFGHAYRRAYWETQRKEGFWWTLTGQKFKLNFANFSRQKWPEFGKMRFFTNPLLNAIFPILRPITQKTREGCGCFWGLCGSSGGKLRESPGKNCWNQMLQILGFSGTKKGKTCREPWGQHSRGPCPNLLCGMFFWNRQFSAFSSFSVQHIPVDFSDASGTFSRHFYVRIRFAGLLLRQGEVFPPGFQAKFTRIAKKKSQRFLWGFFFATPTPHMQGRKHEQKIWPQTAESALFLSSYFLPCMWGGRGH